MKAAYIKLHISVILAGFTGILGKLITLNEGLLVWYRMMIAALLLLLILIVSRKFVLPSYREVLKIGGIGVILALHWVFFYGSIKYSNVSVGVVCFSLVSFFTAIFDSIINRHKPSLIELLFSLIAVSGVLLIFQFDMRYRVGIILGIIGAALIALFMVFNKKIGEGHSSSTILLYELIGGFIGLSFLLPIYLYYFPVGSILPDMVDWVYLLLLAFFCTIGMCLLQIQALQKISAFTVNLTYNLEPIYSIVLAMIFLNEANELNRGFYFGLSLIVISVILQMFHMRRQYRLQYREEHPA